VIELLLPSAALILLVALDLASCIARAAYQQTSHARLLAVRERYGSRVNTPIALLPALTRLRASLNLVLVTTRFLLAGCVLWLVQVTQPPYPMLVMVGALLLAAILLFWSEWIFERMAIHSPEAWVIHMRWFVRFVMLISAVLLVPLAPGSTFANPAETAAGVTEDELKTLVDAGQEEGVFEHSERRMIYSIFDLGDTVAREIMVPRTDMLALDINTPLPDAVDALMSAGHSRVPVYEETVDHTLGLLYAKDLLRAWREDDQWGSLRDLLRPAYFVPEAKKVDDLLAEMQNKRIHMAIVVDEYGGVAGLVTLEDIVEEIFGEIRDEYDQGEEAPAQQQEDGSYLFLSRIGLDDFNEIMGSTLCSEEADTLGGFIYNQLGRAPTVGEKVVEGSLVLTVEQVSARRIHKVRAQWLSTAEQGEDKEHVDG
jgi:putative hemolysin